MRLAEFILAVPQCFVHRFGDTKRIVRRALAPILPNHLIDQADGESKADPTPLFERGILDRSKGVVTSLIDDSVSAQYGFVDSSILMNDHRGAVAGTPAPYDFWWFLTVEMWLRRYHFPPSSLSSSSSLSRLPTNPSITQT